MGTYGTFTGVVRWYDADTQTGYILSLRDGEVQASMVGDGITAANDNIALDANGMIVHDLTNASIITPVFGVGVTQDVLRSSEEFDDWEKHNTAAVTADTQISPMGVEQIADTVSLPAVDDYILRTSITSPKLQDGESGIFSVWLRAATAGTIQLRASRYAAGTTMATADVAVTTEWRRFSVTFSNGFGVEVRVNISIKRADSSQLTEVYAWGAQLTFGVARAVPYWPLQNAGNGLEAGMFVRGILGVGGYQNQLVVGSGWSTIPTGARTVAVGFATGHDSTGDDLVAIGSNAGHTSTGADVIAIGRLTTAGSYGNVILLGPYAEATAANQVVIGSGTVEYTDMYAGGGVSQSTPPNFTLHATGGSGTNIAGGALKLAGGQGTGSGAGGSIILQYAPAGGSGSSANALVDCLTISSAGIVIKPAADSTTAIRVQNAAGSTDLLTVDTTNGSFGINEAPLSSVALLASKSINTSTNSTGLYIKATRTNHTYTIGSRNVTGVDIFAYSTAVASDVKTATQTGFQITNTVTADTGLNAVVSTLTSVRVTSPVISGAGTKTISSARGLWISNQGSSSVGTAVGLYIDAQSGSATTYALYCNGGQSVLLAGASATNPLMLRGAASQTANMLEIQNSSAAILAQIDANGGLTINEQGADTDSRIEGDTATNLLVVDAGLDAVQIGTTTAGVIADFRSASIVLNEDGSDRDTRIEGDTEPNLFLLDASADTIYEGGTTTRQAIDKNGDSWFEGSGAGMPLGSAYGNDISWTQATAAQNTWYPVSDTDMADGQLNLVTHDGSGKLTVTKAGKYLINYSLNAQWSVASQHVESGIGVTPSGGSITVQNDGRNHIEGSASTDRALSGTAILSLAASDAVEVCVRTTTSGTPNITVDFLNLALVQIGA